MSESPVTIDELIDATHRRQLAWSRDDDPQATWHGRLVFVGRHHTYIRIPDGWVTVGPADDLRRTIEHAQEGQ